MQSLFELEARPSDPVDIFNYRFKDLGKKIPEDIFARTIFFGIVDKLNEIKSILVKYAPEWPVNKIDPVERSILYVGIYELVYMDDAPHAVVINEAIEIAKTYADENSNKFINGVLNAIAKNEPKKI